jgi:kynurenine formamidase
VSFDANGAADGDRGIVDLTRPLGPETLVFPGDPKITLARVADHLTEGYEVTQICLGSHSGTHLDAPRHFFPDGAALSDYPMGRLVADGVVLDVRGARSRIVDRYLLAAQLEEWPVKPGEFVLLWTGEAGGNPADTPESTALTAEAAALLLDLGVTLVGTDGPGLDSEGGSYPIHRLLLGAGVLLAENLCNLDLLGPGRARCVFLPLAVDDTDGAPVRAVAWRLRASTS